MDNALWEYFDDDCWSLLSMNNIEMQILFLVCTEGEQRYKGIYTTELRKTKLRDIRAMREQIKVNQHAA